MVCAKAETLAVIRNRVTRISLISVALLHISEFEISPPFLSRVGAIEKHRAVDPDLLSPAVNTERISRPEDHVRILADFNRSDLVVQSQGPRRIYRQQIYRLVFGDIDSGGASRVHRFGHFLIQP